MLVWLMNIAGADWEGKTKLLASVMEQEVKKKKASNSDTGCQTEVMQQWWGSVFEHTLKFLLKWTSFVRYYCFMVCDVTQSWMGV